MPLWHLNRLTMNRANIKKALSQDSAFLMKRVADQFYSSLQSG